ncbi:MAG: hypothetical protein ABH848_00960 [Candidatus Omnitrophota bacterium]
MKKVLALAVCFIFLSGIECFAEFDKKHSFELGTEVSYIKNEYGSDIEEWSGTLYGLAGAYTFRDEYMIRLEGRASLGEVDFESQSSGSADGIDDYILEIRGLIGYDFAPSLESTLTPYIGIGNRYLNDDMANMSNIPGFEREVNYVYVPIGAELMYDNTYLDKGWVFGTRAEYDLLWEGEDKGSGYKVKLDRGDGDGAYRFSFRAIRRFENIDLIIEPFYRYWNVEKSKSVTDRNTNIERKSKSDESGIKLMVRF